MPTGRLPESFSSTSAARSARSRSVAWSSRELNSWIQEWMPSSCPAETTARASSGWIIAETAGMKKVAGTPYLSSSAMIRGVPRRAPY